MEVQHRMVCGDSVDRLGMDTPLVDADQGIQEPVGSDPVEQGFDLEIGGYYPAEG